MNPLSAAPTLGYRCQTIQSWNHLTLTEKQTQREVLKALQRSDLLVNGLKELALMFPDFGVVHLPHQLGVFINEPRLPENISSCVFHLWERVSIVAFSTQFC